MFRVGKTKVKTAAKKVGGARLTVSFAANTIVEPDIANR
jgi:hypothetical protein